MARRGPVERALDRALQAIELAPADAAAAELARVYARFIDGGGSLWHVGGQFRALLVELRLTPQARGLAAENPLQAFRAEREARLQRLRATWATRSDR